jgi:hypothetical protein
VTGALPYHAAFPGERTAASMVRISRGTYRRALKVLVDEGLVAVVESKGTYAIGMFADGQALESDDGAASACCSATRRRAVSRGRHGNRLARLSIVLGEGDVLGFGSGEGAGQDQHRAEEQQDDSGVVERHQSAQSRLVVGVEGG